jgi:uncharacterized protein YbaR (Trm112 family)
MSVSAELLEILVCPETKQPVAPAPQELLARLTERLMTLAGFAPRPPQEGNGA